MSQLQNIFDGQLDVVATLRDRAIEASVNELRKQDELTIALRSALRSGVDIENLSEASGLTVESIRSRVESELNLGEDLEGLLGLR